MQSEGWETGCSATVCPPTMTSSTYVSPGDEKSEMIDLSSDLDHKKRLMVLCLSGSRGFENCFQVPFKPHELRWDGFLCSKIYIGDGKEKKEYIKQQVLLTANDFFLALKEGEGGEGTPGSWLVHLFPPQKPAHLYSGVSGCTPVPFFLGLIPTLNGLQSRCSFR